MLLRGDFSDNLIDNEHINLIRGGEMKSIALPILICFFIGLSSINVFADNTSDFAVQAGVGLIGGLMGGKAKKEDNQQQKPVQVTPPENTAEVNKKQALEDGAKRLQLQRDTELKVFWVKEQPLLDQKIKDGKILKIKGLYLGMNIDEALSILTSKLGYNLEVIYNPETKEYYLIEGVLGLVDIKADNNKSVKEIGLAPAAVDELFNSKGLPGEDFAKKFVDSYHISQMEPFSEYKGSVLVNGWRYISPEGYRLVLTVYKEIFLDSIAKKAEMKFD